MTGFCDGSRISWTICKQSAARCRQITTPTPHHSVFYRPYALPDAQPTVKALKAQATNLRKLMEFEHEADRRASSSVAADFVNVTHETVAR